MGLQFFLDLLNADQGSMVGFELLAGSLEFFLEVPNAFCVKSILFHLTPDSFLKDFLEFGHQFHFFSFDNSISSRNSVLKFLKILLTLCLKYFWMFFEILFVLSNGMKLSFLLLLFFEIKLAEGFVNF